MKARVAERLFSYLSVILQKLHLVSPRASGVSVDQSLAVSFGLLDLVVVLVNDVKEHRLRRERETISGNVELKL